MNRKIRNIVWYAFLAWSAVMVIDDIDRHCFLSFFDARVFTSLFFHLAAIVVLLEAVAHVGWRQALMACAMVGIGSGFAFWFVAPQLELSYTGIMGPRICHSLPLNLPALAWCLIGGFYLLWHRILPIFDARVVAFLTALSTLGMEWLIFQPYGTSWRNYFAWLIGAYFFARFIPLKGDSKPVSCFKPLTVILIMAALFLLSLYEKF